MKKKQNSIEPIACWFLISCLEDDGRNITDWHIAWYEPFGTKKAALSFARSNNWPRPYKAARGLITVQHL